MSAAVELPASLLLCFCPLLTKIRIIWIQLLWCCDHGTIGRVVYTADTLPRADSHAEQERKMYILKLVTCFFWSLSSTVFGSHLTMNNLARIGKNHSCDHISVLCG